MSDPIEIGIIGGSGLYNMPELTETQETPVRTPFGSTSDSLITGKIGGVPVVFLPRHGRGHRYTPSEVPYLANLYALKSLGVKYLVSVSACGSLREDYAPGHLCIPDQVVDRTYLRRNTFFGEGLVAHVGMADPFSPELNALLIQASKAAGATVHEQGTFVTSEGPRFATRAESEAYRTQGYSIIGMTTATEAFLALEAEIAYSVYAHITDYDVWRMGEEVDVNAVLKQSQKNLQIIQQSILKLIPLMSAVEKPFKAHHALSGAIMTTHELIPPKTIEKLRPIIAKYIVG
jgi:5'-methylthioadenosine phosphorylase